jgi:glycine/D-amino acid oxidase-like deaminating enzyme
MKLQSGYPFSLVRYGLPFSYPKLLQDIKTDVAIVGGGISGALNAYYLTEAGLDCVVVDGRTIGLGSTCASTSLLQYEIDTPLNKLIEKIGEQDAVKAYTLCRAAIYTLAKLAAKLNVPSFQLKQSLYYAAYKKHVKPLYEEYLCRKRYGFEVDFLSDAELGKKFNLRAPAGILSQDGAYADAYVFTHALLQYGIRNNLRVFDRTFIKNIVTHKGYTTLVTAQRFRVMAKKIIFATGYEAARQLAKKTVDLRSTYVTISENLPPEHLSFAKDYLIWNTAHPYLYMRATEDNRILVGGRDEKFSSFSARDKKIDSKRKLLLNDYERAFPGSRFSSEFCWAGTFGETKDGLPTSVRMQKIAITILRWPMGATASPLV